MANIDVSANIHVLNHRLKSVVSYVYKIRYKVELDMILQYIFAILMYGLESQTDRMPLNIRTPPIALKLCRQSYECQLNNCKRMPLILNILYIIMMVNIQFWTCIAILESRNCWTHYLQWLFVAENDALC